MILQEHNLTSLEIIERLVVNFQREYTVLGTDIFNEYDIFFSKRTGSLEEAINISNERATGAVEIPPHLEAIAEIYEVYDSQGKMIHTGDPQE